MSENKPAVDQDTRDTVELLQMQLQEMTERQKTLEQAMAGGAGAVEETPESPFTEERIKAFLNAPRPVTEFFSLPELPGVGGGQFRQVCLIIDTRKHNPITQAVEQAPGLTVAFQPWGGVGSERRDPNTKRLRNFGHFDLARHDMIAVTKEDIEQYKLVGVEPKDGPFKLETALAAMRQCKDFKREKIITGEEFRIRMEAEYAGLWSQIRAEKAMREKLSQARTREQVKAGLVAAK